MSEGASRDILLELLDGRLTAAQAAGRLLAAAGSAPVGLGVDPTGLAPDVVRRLEALLPALRWEMTKQLVPGRLPEVAFDSPEYHAWLARLPPARTDRSGVARFLPPDALPEEPA